MLDVLNGMQNGPRGRTVPKAKGGLSPITMAILALLAYKGIKHMSGGQASAAPGANPARIPPSDPMNTRGGIGDILGGLLGGGAGAARGGAQVAGDLLKGGLGGLLAGGAAGSVLSGGLGGLLNQLQQNGQGQVAQSWVGKGPNQDISTNDLAKSIGIDDIDAIASHTGLSRNDLLAGLSRELPGVIDQLTPDGRLPTADELSQRV